MAFDPTCDPCPSPPASILTEQQRMCVLVFVEVGWGVWERRGACCTSTTMLLVGSCALCYEGEWRVAPRVTHVWLPPALISTAQQRMCVLVFVEVEQGLCEHRGACCTSTAMFLVGSCAFFK